MRVRTPCYYKEFHCIDKACTDSCCAGWEVDLDEDSYAYYQTVNGEFGLRLKSVMVFEGGENRFKLRDNGRCPFLNDENLCDLYIALGEDRLCRTCAEHPRYTAEYGDLREKGISLSCPEAARIILSNREPVTYETEVNDEPIAGISNLDPQKYAQLVMARKEAYIIAGDRSRPISQRMKTLLEEGVKQQRQLSKAIVNTSLGKKHLNKQETILQWILYIQDYECINPVWNQMLAVAKAFLEEKQRMPQDYQKSHEDFEAYYGEGMVEYEQMLLYFLYRYYVTSIYDDDLLSKLKLAVFGVLLCEEIGVAVYEKSGRFVFQDQIEVMHCFSRQFEHSDDNVAAINDGFQNNPLFDVGQFLNIL